MKICSECQTEFQPTNNRQLACPLCKVVREVRIRRERRQSDPEIQKRCREATQKYRDNNRELVRQRDRKKYWSNPNKRRQQSNEYRKRRHQHDVKWRDKCLQRQVEYRQEHGERLNKESRERYRQDEEYRQKCISQAKKWHRSNRNHKLAYNKQYYKNNYERFAAANLTKHSREPIESKIIKQVYQEDNYTCQYCGTYGGKLTIDHKIPVSRGGNNNRNNLCVACHSCNCSKGAKTPEEFEVYLKEIKC